MIFFRFSLALMAKVLVKYTPAITLETTFEYLGNRTRKYRPVGGGNNNIIRHDHNNYQYLFWSFHYNRRELLLKEKTETEKEIKLNRCSPRRVSSSLSQRRRRAWNRPAAWYVRRSRKTARADGLFLFLFNFFIITPVYLSRLSSDPAGHRRHWLIMVTSKIRLREGLIEIESRRTPRIQVYIYIYIIAEKYTLFYYGGGCNNLSNNRKQREDSRWGRGTGSSAADEKWTIFF